MIADSLVTDTLIANPLHWETVKLIINSQHNLAVIGISVLVGVTLLIVAFNWLSIRSDVEKIIEKVDEKLEKVDKKMQLMDKILQLTNKKMKTMNKMLQSMNKKTELTDEMLQLVNEKTKLMDKEIAKFNTDKSRLFAIAARQSGEFDAEAYWWAKALKGYASPEARSENLIRTSVKNLTTSLKECLKKDEKLEDEVREKIEEALPHIPESLDKEKKKIEDLLKKLPKK
ncbi:hypothetical protein KAW50_06405 [candidate division WOR-3 bacterium]|nr:hypothetical protein [candidate division WOR-3 bacterium]